MSPEQARGEDVDARSDLFSFGAVLYQMATGMPPFTGPAAAVIFEAILNRPPIPPLQTNPKLPEKLIEIIHKGLEKDRELRYQQASEIRSDLKRLKRDTESGRAPRISSVTAGWDLGGETGHKQRWASRYRRLALLAGGVVVLLLIAAVVYKQLISKPPRSSAPLSVARLTTSGSVELAAISPDGEYVAYVEPEGGKFSVWLYQIATATRSRLLAPGPGVYGSLRFSPEGSYLYYTRGDSDYSPLSLYRLAVLGGTPEKLITDFPPRFALSPDGKSLARAGRDPKDKRGTLVVVSITGSDEKVIVKAEENTDLSKPAWSRDGKLLAAVEESLGETVEHHNLLVVPVDGGPAKKITSGGWWRINQPEWLADGSGLVAAAFGHKVVNSAGQVKYEGTHHQLWEFPYPGGNPRRIMNDLFRYDQASLTADSTSLVTVASDLVSSIWVGPASDPDQARAVTSRGGHFVGVRGLAWTPGGKIVYFSNAGDAYEFIVMDADGGNPHPLPRDLPYKADPDVCPDGHTLVYTGVYAATGEIMLQSLEGGRPHPLIEGWGSVCSPDGKWVVYYSNHQPDSDIPRKIPIEGGKPVLLTEKACLYAGLSPDGKWLACVQSHEQPFGTLRLAVIPFSGGKPVKLFLLSPTFDGRAGNGGAGIPLRWTADSQSVVYVDTRGGVGNLWAQPAWLAVHPEP